jgi:DNA repair exonuclease SbcCD ATPase subunit
MTIGTLESAMRDVKDDIARTKAKQYDWDEVQAKQQTTSTAELRADEELLEKLRTELGTHDLAYDSAETELRHSQKQLDAANNKHATALNKYSSATLALNAADDALNALKDELRNTTDECPTCGASLRGKKLDDHKRAVRAKIKEAESVADAAYRTATATGQAKNAEAEQVKRHQDDVRRFREASDVSIDKRTQMQTRVSELKARVDLAKSVRDRTKTERNPWDEVLQQHRERKDKLSDELDNADALLRIVSERHQRAKFWVSGFKTVRLYLLEEFLNELEVITQDMLPRLGLIGWEVMIGMEKEKADGEFSTGLTVSIRKPGGTKAVKWESFSGGEAQRLRIAGALALSETLLRRAGVRCDLVILDEPTQHMAPEGVDDLVECLLEYGRDYQVFLVDHVARETKRMAAVVTVVRTRAGSQIEAG